MIYCDTSFLVGLYQSGDAFHITAKKLMGRSLESIALTLLVEFELLNTIHRALASRTIKVAQHDAILRQVAADEADGILVRSLLTDIDLYARARAIAAKFSVEINFRSLDILHVAAAEILHVADFVSYDVKQRSLAQKVGLSLLPRTLSAK